jgi:hypothetical protein
MIGFWAGVQTSKRGAHRVIQTLFVLCILRFPKTVFSMEGEGVVNGGGVFLAMFNGVGFQLNDLVDVFVGTGKGVTGNKVFPIKGRFKGVRVEKGEERFLCRPIVGSQKGRCPSFPPESCLKVKAFGSDVYGERKPLFFSKLTTKVQKRSPPPLESKPLPSAPSPAPPPNLNHLYHNAPTILQAYVKGKQ